MPLDDVTITISCAPSTTSVLAESATVGINPTATAGSGA